MLRLTFKQTDSELMVRAAATVLFSALKRQKTREVNIAELAEHPQYGFTASAVSEPVGPKLVRITDLKDGKIDWNSVPYCNCTEPEKYLLYENDILFARTGATTGKTHLVRSTERAVFASYLIRLRPRPEVDAGYLYAFFQSDNYWSQISEEKEGSAQPNVNGDKLASLRTPIVEPGIQRAIANFLFCVRQRRDGYSKELPELPPPLVEQRRVVARIEELSARIEEARDLRKQAAEEVEALLEASVGKLMSDSGKHRKERLYKLTTKIGSGSTPLGGRAAYPRSGIPFIRSLNVRARRFQWENIAYISPQTHIQMAGTRVQPNDVLLNITGASIGRVACAPADLSEGNVNQHVAIIRPRDVLQPRYLMYWLSQPAVQEFINDEQKGATRQGFTKAQIEEFQIPIPPIPEQRRIVAYLDDVQKQTDALKALQAETSAEVDALMPSILDKAFRGEL